MSEIAEIDDMGVDEDFFHRGGKSWGALALMMKLEERSGVRISLLDVFHSRTPGNLAALIAERTGTGGVSR
jgi:acyl carrier protein